MRFQSTLPARGATLSRIHCARIIHFNPRSPHGERLAYSTCFSLTPYFNPRSPHGERRWAAYSIVERTYFNPRSPHGERQGDGKNRDLSFHFNPRSPHGERRLCRPPFMPKDGQFQSTLPARGATSDSVEQMASWEISIHAPRTGSDTGGHAGSPRRHISIHAPRTGSDARCADGRGSKKFQSTLPARGATRFHGKTVVQVAISIHAPRTGSDRAEIIRRPPNTYFNPRSPHGERRDPSADRSPLRAFQSTLPARGATA